jgi:methionine synthase II (cobalamin-independent)
MQMAASASRQRQDLYELPTTLRVTTTGAWARPGWYDLLAATEAEGKFGPEDVDELYTDYATLAIKDQEDCGLDILTDGEVRRKSWIRYIVQNVPNIQRLPLRRRLGPYGWDQQETYALGSKIENLESISFARMRWCPRLGTTSNVLSRPDAPIFSSRKH